MRAWFGLCILFILLLTSLAGPVSADSLERQWITQGPWSQDSPSSLSHMSSPFNGNPLVVATRDQLYFFERGDPIPYDAFPIAPTQMLCGVTVSGSGNSMAVRDAYGVRVYSFTGHGLELRWEDVWEARLCADMWFSPGGERLYLVQDRHLEARGGIDGDVLWRFQNPVFNRGVFADYSPFADRLLVGHPGGDITWWGTSFLVDGETGLVVLPMHIGTSPWTSGVVSHDGNMGLVKAGSTLSLYQTPSPAPIWQKSMADTRGQLNAGFFGSLDAFAVSDGEEQQVTRVYEIQAGDVAARDFEIPGRLAGVVLASDHLVTVEDKELGRGAILRIANATTGEVLTEQPLDRASKWRFQVEDRGMNGLYVNTGHGQIEHYLGDVPSKPPGLTILQGPGCPDVVEEATRWTVACKDVEEVTRIFIRTGDGGLPKDARLQWQPRLLCSSLNGPSLDFNMDGWSDTKSAYYVHPYEFQEAKRTQELVGHYVRGNQSHTDRHGTDGFSILFRLIDGSGMMSMGCADFEIEQWRGASSFSARESPGVAVGAWFLFVLVATVGWTRMRRA